MQFYISIKYIKIDMSQLYTIMERVLLNFNVSKFLIVNVIVYFKQKL